MCGVSYGKIAGRKATFCMGNDGGLLKVDDYDFSYSIAYFPKGRREDLIQFFSIFSKLEIVEMLADFVENAEEG